MKGTDPLTKRILIAVLACLLVIAATGCGIGGGGHTEETGGEPSARSENAAAGTMTNDPSPSPAPATPAPTPAPTPQETPKGQVHDGWVSGIPDYVPRFSCGMLDIKQCRIGEASINTVFQLCFTGVRRADIDGYHKALKAAGYAAAAVEIGDTYMLTASKDFGWNSVSLVITLTEADGVVTYALDAPV